MLTYRKISFFMWALTYWNLKYVFLYQEAENNRKRKINRLWLYEARLSRHSPKARFKIEEAQIDMFAQIMSLLTFLFTVLCRDDLMVTSGCFDIFLHHPSSVG